LKENQKNIIEFTILFNRYKKKIYNYVLKMTSDSMLAEDVVQNVFLKLYENLDRIHNKESINFWLITTARNEMYSHFRSAKRKADDHQTDLEDVDIVSPVSMEYEFDIHELKEIILKELDTLPEEQKEVFILKEYTGMNYKEIANVLNIDTDLVKSRIYKTRQKLIKRLSNKIFN
jgi:RNA polymerase sigma-70 factor (ECF subfamily)